MIEIADETKAKEMAEELKEIKQYEIKMWQLMALVIIGIFVALIFGFYFGDRVGAAEATSNINVELPNYCTYTIAKGEVTIVCNELEDLSANEVCNMLSTPLKDKIHVVIATS